MLALGGPSIYTILIYFDAFCLFLNLLYLFQTATRPLSRHLLGPRLSLADDLQGRGAQVAQPQPGPGGTLGPAGRREPKLTEALVRYPPALRVWSWPGGRLAAVQQGAEALHGLAGPRKAGPLRST